MTINLRIVLLSTALLVPACSKASAEGTTPPTPPVAGKPTDAKTPAAPAPVAPAPVVNKAPEAAKTPAAPETSALAMPSLTNLGEFLATIKDGPTATAAKAPLEAFVKQLETTKAAAAPTPAKPDALGGLTGKIADVAAKIGISPEITKQIGALLENPSVKAVIGDALTKLQGLAK